MVGLFLGMVCQAAADCEAVLADAAKGIDPEWVALGVLPHQFYVAELSASLGLQCDEDDKPVAYVQLLNGPRANEAVVSIAGLADALQGIEVDDADLRRCIRRVESDSEKDVWLAVGKLGLNTLACSKDEDSQFFRFYIRPDRLR